MTYDQSEYSTLNGVLTYFSVTVVGRMLADDDENSEKYFKSSQTIEKLTQQLGKDQKQNGNSKQQMDFELEKKRILDEAQVKFVQKLKAVQAAAKRNLKQKLEDLEAEHEMNLERIAKKVQEQIVSAGKRKRVNSPFDFVLEGTPVEALPNLDFWKKQTVPKTIAVKKGKRKTNSKLKLAFCASE